MAADRAFLVCGVGVSSGCAQVPARVGDENQRCGRLARTSSGGNSVPLNAEV